MREDGTKDMLSFQLTDREDCDSWRAFMVDCKSEGAPMEEIQQHKSDGARLLGGAKANHTHGLLL
jgi:transposase-like protein